MNRLVVLALLLAAVPIALAQSRPPAGPGTPAPAAPPFPVVEATIPEMRRAMEEGRLTSRALVTQYLARIAMYEDRVNAAISVNPKALEEADARDRERQRGRARGPLHGIPIALKDNIQAFGMPTTGGALGLDGFMAPYEATVVKQLRDAGAVIIAKTVLTELANWVAGAPTPMPGNYTGVAGHAFNPYDPRRDPREGSDDGRGVMSTGGSSSGAGTAANLWAANVGTDTSGSVVNPAQLTMLVGIRPTTGLVSRHGIIPITADQDTAGPMARTVTDAAILLGAMTGAAPDPEDAATTRCTPPPNRDYTPFLRRDALKGARIGIPRAYYYEPRLLPGEKAPRGGISAEQAALMRETIEVLTREGAVIVDPADLPSVVDDTIDGNTIVWDTCSGYDRGRGNDAGCSIVFKYGMKRDFNAWLRSLGDRAPFRSLTDLRMWNIAHTRGGAIRYGQSNLDISDEIDLERDKARYEADRAKDLRLAETRGLKAAIEANRLDALLFPGWNASLIGSRPGYPEIVVPNGMVPNAPGSRPFPAGFDARPVPSAAAFVGAACSEAKLIGLAYAYEQASRKRVPPAATP